jgi:superfamily I DNA/RNA helicase
MKWSTQQLDIFECAKNNESLLVHAGPGSGKSTTLVGVANEIEDKQVLLIVFNNAIANELQEKMPSNVIVSTMHALGNSIVREYPGKFEFNKWLHDKKFGSLDKKINQVFFYALRDQGFDFGEANQMIKYLKDVCDKLRLHLVDDYDNEEKIVEVLNYYNLPLERIDLIKECMLRMNNALRFKSWVDYTDMITAPTLFDMPLDNVKVKGIPYSFFDTILIDEAQDTSSAVISLIEKMFLGKQIIAVGDPNQSINGFAGALPDSMEQLKTRLNLKTMPLTITYRCPKTHVDNLNNIFGTELICGNDREGNIEEISVLDVVNYLSTGDMVISRTQKGKDSQLLPVMQMAIKEEMPCRLLGFNLVKIAKDHFASVMKKVKAKHVDYDTFYMLEQHVQELRESLLEKKWSLDTVDSVMEDAEMVLSLFMFFVSTNSMETWEGFLKWLHELESNKNSCVTFSTIHRCKGGEAKNVFILQSNNLPAYRKENQDWMNSQEDNVHYVALSRSLETLYLVN